METVGITITNTETGEVTENVAYIVETSDDLEALFNTVLGEGE